MEETLLKIVTSTCVIPHLSNGNMSKGEEVEKIEKEENP